MEGRRATTHWLYTDLFRERFPGVLLDSDILYADDGQFVTAAGSAAGLDMLMHVIRVWEGSSVSNRIARRLNVAPHRDGGQAQFIPRPVPNIADDRINRLIAWMRDNCTRTINVEELASQVAMSPRNFYRHFRSVTGHTPYNWLLRERIGVAMELLEAGRLTIDRIAESSGFSSADALRTQFQRIVGVSPSDYRRMFACQGADCKGEPAEVAPATEFRRVA
jgi:AraC family transcriptional activator FtrA